MNVLSSVLYEEVDNYQRNGELFTEEVGMDIQNRKDGNKEVRRGNIVHYALGQKALCHGEGHKEVTDSISLLKTKPLILLVCEGYQVSLREIVLELYVAIGGQNVLLSLLILYAESVVV